MQEMHASSSQKKGRRECQVGNRLLLFLSSAISPEHRFGSYERLSVRDVDDANTLGTTQLQSVPCQCYYMGMLVRVCRMQSVTVNRVYAPETLFTTQALATFATSSRPNDDKHCS